MTVEIGRVAIGVRVSTVEHGQDPDLQPVPLSKWAAAPGGRMPPVPGWGTWSCACATKLRHRQE